MCCACRWVGGCLSRSALDSLGIGMELNISSGSEGGGDKFWRLRKSLAPSEIRWGGEDETVAPSEISWCLDLGVLRKGGEGLSEIFGGQ